ncbi:MAG: hypothetical protein ACKV22_29755 [Bryobacteraceae bacterium]
MIPTLLLLLWCVSASAQTLSRDTGKPVELGPHRQLFFDDSVLESRHGLTRVVHKPVKLPKPIIVGDQPWEGWAVYPHGSPCVLWDDEDKVYKMWYQAYSVSPPQKERYVMCYATSKDGMAWQKPKLGIHEFRGSRDNNIVIMGNSQWALTNVIKDPRDPDPKRRYKSLSWDDHAISVAFSPDGIRWDLYSGNPVMKGTGDSHNILPYDESIGKYVGYLRPGRELGQGKRVIGYSVSDDFIRWSPIEVILRPDTLDPLGDEFYQMPVMKYEGKYLGFLWVYHNAPKWPWPRGIFDRKNLRGSEQTLDTQLTFSHNGKDFIRAGDRATFLGVGAPGAWDEGMVDVSTVVPRGDDLWVYYAGSTAKHFFEDLLNLNKVVNGRRWMIAIGLARLRRDRFVSLRAGPQEGFAMTRLVSIGEASQLIVNANAIGGQLEVELVDEYIRPVPGFTRAEFTPIRTDGVSQVCRWKKNLNLAALSGKTVRLRFYLRSADLFAFELVKPR